MNADSCELVIPGYNSLNQDYDTIAVLCLRSGHYYAYYIDPYDERKL